MATEIQRVCDFDFLRCQKCGRIVTKLQMQRAIGDGGDGRACPCGSLKYSPANLPWYGWFWPRVWVFACQRLRGLA